MQKIILKLFLKKYSKLNEVSIIGVTPDNIWIQSWLRSKHILFMTEHEKAGWKSYLATDQENIMIIFCHIRKYHITFAEIMIYA